MKDKPTDMERQTHYREIADRGDRARLVIKYQGEFLDEIRENAIHGFETSMVDDRDGHQMLRIYLECLSDIRGKMISAAEQGKAAWAELAKVDLNKLN